MPKGMNVKSNLLELKNLSEVILDLAYSSIFLEDKELADYVKELYEEIIELEIRTIEILFKVEDKYIYRNYSSNLLSLFVHVLFFLVFRVKLTNFLK